LGEARDPGRLKPTIAGENHIGLIDNYWIEEAKSPDARRNLTQLPFRVSSRVPRIGSKLSDRHQIRMR
jgi:hypothetical protein